MRNWKPSVCVFPRTSRQPMSSLASEGRSRAWHVVVLCAMLLSCAPLMAQQHGYHSIVVFGDSLSDVGNFADLTQAKFGVRVPGPIADYTDGRFTDGIDTIPYTRKYEGVWVEQLAGMLPTRPGIRASLDGGKDYAYGDARTDVGTSVVHFGPGNVYSVTVSNIGKQVSDYLATHPKINADTLFVLWGGADDVLSATNAGEVVDAAVDQVENVNRLIEAGARRILVLNLPPLGAIPRLNGIPAAALAENQATVLFNDTLAAGLEILRLGHAWRHVSLREMNVFSLVQHVIASPSTFGLMNVTGMSQGLLTANPDQYLFWDDLHPTTAGHHIVALKALQILEPERCRIMTGPWTEPECGELP